MTPAEQLHLDASAYANKRLAMHKEAIKQQKQTPLDEQVHGGNWVAHYEGYVAGYKAQEPDFGPQPDMHFGMNQDDWKDIVAAISKARDSRGIYLACRPADVFQDWFLAMGLFKPKEKNNG